MAPSGGEYVCARCLGDDAGLKVFIEEHAEAKYCDFCRRKGATPFATRLSDVAAFMRDCLQQDYGDADEHLPYETREGGYQGATYDTYDLLTDELQLGLDTKLLGKLCGEIGDMVWCDSSPFRLSPVQELKYSWERFCRQVKHESRFFVFAPPSGTTTDANDELLSPGDLLDLIGHAAADGGAIKTFSAATSVFRVRKVKRRSEIRGARDLGSPPLEKAEQNRMSAAGISLFYGSDDQHTALAEVESGKGIYAIGEFRALREFRMLDLTALPGLPEFFEIGNRKARDRIMFLQQFAREVSKPVTDPHLVHIDYVPTQAVTEYFRSVFKDRGRHLDGIAYPSAARKGGRSFVLFATPEDIVLSESELQTTPNGVSRLLLRERQKSAWLRLQATHWHDTRRK